MTLGPLAGRTWAAAAIVALLMVLPPGAAAVRSADPVDLDLDGIEDGLEQRLGDLYAPVLFIEPDEQNYPTNVDWFLEGAQLWYHEDCTFDVEESVPMTFPIGTQPRLLYATTGGLPWGHPNAFGAGHDENGLGATATTPAITAPSSP